MSLLGVEGDRAEASRRLVRDDVAGRFGGENPGHAVGSERVSQSAAGLLDETRCDPVIEEAVDLEEVRAENLRFTTDPVLELAHAPPSNTF